MRNESYKMQNTFSSISTNKEWNYEDGIVFTPHGIVHVYSQGDEEKKHRPHTYIRFVYQGRMHIRTLNKKYTRRGLAIMAGKFIREVSNG